MRLYQSIIQRDTVGSVITRTSLYVACLQPLCLAWGLYLLAFTQEALAACCKKDERQTGARKRIPCGLHCLGTSVDTHLR